MKSGYLIILFFIFFIACKKSKRDDSVTPQAEFIIKGADVSMLPQIRQNGYKLYNASGVLEDQLLTLKNAGVNTIRLRLWNHPLDAHSDMEEVKTLAVEARNMGFKIWITVHYSDTWADPGNQSKPNAWSQLDYNTLKDSVYAFTAFIVNQIKPDYIQIGNEVNNGILWPEGNINQKDQFVQLLKTGISAVRKNSSTSKIILHYAGFKDVLYFMDYIGELDVDLIGLSYYPMWHGNNLDSLKIQLNNLSVQTGKNVLIAETSYPFTLGYNDWTNNVLGDSSQLHPSFPASPAGQSDFLKRIRLVSSQINKGSGFCYWGGEWVSFKGPVSPSGSPYENQAFWDFSGKALPVLDAYK